ncbi:MAG TPA: protein translocase subunit SecF [Acidimicrobiales bacterium]|nr:protein translocase subunit SecF [Acidimicrobiales bacterium]
MTANGRRRGPLGRLYHGETDIDFLGRAKICFAVSALVIVTGLVLLATRGLNVGIDFEGGTSWTVPGEVEVSEAREVMASFDVPDAEIQVLGGVEGEQLRVQAEPGVDTEGVRVALAELADVDPDEVQVTDVSPSWGSQITEKALRALAFFLVAITIYISLRFEWRMALATLVALVHDILFTISVYALANFEVTPATVVAILTILGYSIYDGIVVFDRVDENARLLATSGATTYSAMVNDSLNQVLMRTLNTSVTALLPVASLLIVGSFVLGAATLQEFALALLVGLAASAYSSPLIASPVLAWLKEREPRYAALRHRLEGRTVPLVASGGAALAGSSATTGSRTTSDGANGARRSEPSHKGPARPAPTITPRPRKKGRRR